ncbi:DUF3373 domain-containing protein [Desulfuromonas sp. KJ2020]|uniref:DUF3373 domain-containing protein n=1 Tax=Desulfuromonas sp. KJ2020 TaxID=2919173 RepID=UPI0020A81CA8|nr:DUF3373 domain-containing protein [Desulfuromonas sp. KJ2020]MCP3175892.1 DUF3373 domain-containing protein [Desulfuromonas sp. KJ2020]
MRKLMAILLAALLVAPATALAATSIEELQKKIEELTDEVDYLSGRVDKTEKHTALDRIEFSGDLRAKADTLHYSDVAWSPGMMVDMTGVPGMPPVVVPVSMLTGNPVIPGMMPAVAPEKGDLDNDILYTTRLRLNMKAKVYDNVNFSGRLSMYKNWGDSTGVKVFDSWDSFTMDGTHSGNTTSDSLFVERAYFDWSHIGGSNFYLSIGRRPSTYGPPTQYRENELRGGTPSGHLVNFNFDGVTIGYNLSELTGIEGQTIRFCYGQGFESQYGNGELFTRNDFNTEDTHLGGINFDILNDGTNFLQLTAFAALDVVDGFKGTFAFPSQFVDLFTTNIAADTAMFPNMNFVVRYQPTTVVGDMFLGGLGYAREEMNDVKYFASLGWTRLDPNGKAGMFGGMASDAVFSATTGEIVGVTNTDAKDGYGVYAGVQVPAPLGKFGLEYNFGSKYWTPFTQAQDDVAGSKLATRGHAGEAYYIFDINPNMFIKVGGIYYDYEYTGSGSPVGAPQKVDSVLDGTAFSMLPVVDKAWDGYASLTVKF